MFLADPGLLQSTLLRNSNFPSLLMIMSDAQALIREISNHKPVILWLIGLSCPYIKFLLIFQVRAWLIVLLKRNSLIYKHWYSELWWLKEQKHETFSGTLVPWRLIKAQFHVKREHSIRNTPRADSVKQFAPNTITQVWMGAIEKTKQLSSHS